MDKDPPAPPADPLAGLIDIPLPALVSLWPQTWTSRIAIVVLVGGLIATVWWLARRHLANRYRHAALAELERLGSDVPALALLVRRTALAAFPRTEVATLSGVDWLSFLDRSYGGTGFSQGPGRALADAPYEPEPSSVGTVKGGSGDGWDRAAPAALMASPRQDEERRWSDAVRPVIQATDGRPDHRKHDRELIPLVRRWIRTHHA